MVSNLYSAPNAPPCARYEEGENDQRLLAVWTFVSGLVGGGENAKNISANIARLYDYKGQLVVALRNGIPLYVEFLFRYAWQIVGCEPQENAEFIDVKSETWKDYWGSRRFESDWTP